MSFSASWSDVRADDPGEDLVLANASLSPPLESMADDVREAVEDVAIVAVALVDALPAPPSGRFRVNANGHVRQGEFDPSTVSVGVHELLEA